MAKSRFTALGVAGAVALTAYIVSGENRSPGSTRDTVDTGVEVVDANLSGLAGIAESVVGNGSRVAGTAAGAAAGAANGAAASTPSAANGGGFTRVAPEEANQ